jgi:hypothetical protein
MLTIKRRGGQNICSVDDYLNLRYAECDRGWNGILRKMFQELFEAGWDGGVAQIKEKFGSLRVYLEFVEVEDKSDKLYEIVYKYEILSETVCEVCGADGAKLRTLKDGRSWIKTNCDICHDIFMKNSPKMDLDTRK